MSESTNNKKKIIPFITIAVIVVAAIVGLIWYFVAKQNNEEGALKLNQFYEDLQSKDTYSFTTTLNDENKMYYATQENKAYISTIYKGTESEFIIKDGNTYLVMDDVEAYYTYKNNETDLEKIETELKEIKDLEHENGKEKIENKTYRYEEYKVLTSFTMMNTSNILESEEVKTRFYFKGNDLVYIKTIIGEKEELLKVEISDNIDNKIFEIPSNYKEM